ncbi:MAG: hypothetical protein ACK5SI_01480 [Planctomycetia bacterium]
MSQQADATRFAPRVLVQFDRADRRYRPLDPLAVRYQVDGVADAHVRAIEHSVVWYTEGKGEEDLGVPFFQRLADRNAVAAAARDGSFATQLPRSPLSYEGVIVKIRWCVRVRLFFTAARDFVSEHVFELGSVPPAALPGGGQP